MSAPANEGSSCPSCGAAAPPLLRHSKLAVCSYCNSTLFVEDAQVRSAGEKSVLAEIPSILRMGRRFGLGSWIFEPIGRIRYEYGEGAGYWDEWWVLLSDGKTSWVSNDEGEYVVQSKAALKGDTPPYEKFKIGGKVRMFDHVLACTELNEATCIGFEGQLPEVVTPGDTHRYVHLEGSGGMLITAEYAGETATFFKGLWIDPFEIKTL